MGDVLRALRRKRPPFVALAFLAVVTAAGYACASEGGVAEANAAAAEVDEALQAVFAQGAPEDADDPEQWEHFFESGFERVDELEIAFDRWSRLLDEDDTAPASVLRYRDALGEYVAVLREQAVMSRACMPDGEMTRSAASCYQRLVSRKGAEWDAAARRLERARP